MSTMFQAEEAQRSEIVAEKEKNFSRLLRYTIAPLAVVQLQRCFRGVLTRKRIKLRRKRRMIAAIFLQRIGRGYLLRLHFVVVHDINEPVLRRLVVKASYKAGAPINVTVAAAFVILKFLKSVRARRQCQELRDERQFIHDMATRIQTRFRKFSVRKKVAHILLETKRARHEKLLQQYLKQVVTGTPLNRMAQHNREKVFERFVCQLIIERHLPFHRAVEVAKESFPEVRQPHLASIDMSREEQYAVYCNHRQIFGLDKELTSDSEDDSIDEELLQPSQKASLLKRHRKKIARLVTDEDDIKGNMIAPARHRTKPVPVKRPQTKLRISRVVDRLMYFY